MGYELIHVRSNWNLAELQRSTTSSTQLGFYKVFSNVSYIRGTAVPEPVAVWPAVGLAAVVLGWNR